MKHFAPEFLENNKEMFPWYYMKSDFYNRFKFSATIYIVWPISKDFILFFLRNYEIEKFVTMYSPGAFCGDPKTDIWEELKAVVRAEDELRAIEAELLRGAEIEESMRSGLWADMPKGLLSMNDESVFILKNKFTNDYMYLFNFI